MSTNAALITAMFFRSFFSDSLSVPPLMWLGTCDDIGSVPLSKFVPTGVSEAVLSQFLLFELLAAFSATSTLEAKKSCGLCSAASNYQVKV